MTHHPHAPTQPPSATRRQRRRRRRAPRARTAQGRHAHTRRRVKREEGEEVKRGRESPQRRTANTSHRQEKEALGDREAPTPERRPRQEVLCSFEVCTDTHTLSTRVATGQVATTAYAPYSGCEQPRRCGPPVQDFDRLTPVTDRRRRLGHADIELGKRRKPSGKQRVGDCKQDAWRDAAAGDQQRGLRRPPPLPPRLHAPRATRKRHAGVPHVSWTRTSAAATSARGGGCSTACHSATRASSGGRPPPTARRGAGQRRLRHRLTPRGSPGGPPSQRRPAHHAGSGSPP